jgi:hypothetical protein
LPVIATKWVDFAVTDSTRKESCHSPKIRENPVEVNRRDGPNKEKDDPA